MHSWLFYFNNSIKTSNLPNWFLQWWDYFGCIYEVIKPHLLIEKGFIYFKQNFKPSENEKKFPPILMLCSKFFVPWVCSWYFDYNYQHGYLILIRRYKVKWWDSLAAKSKSSKPAVTE
jgi:hypothetical protein